MVIYDVHYREKGNKDAELKVISVVGHDRESCKAIALSRIGEHHTIVKMTRVG